MTDATELKKVVKQLQSANAEPVIDFRPCLFASRSRLTLLFSCSFLRTGNYRYSPCNEEEFSSE
jgi:hypothetical protein